MLVTQETLALEAKLGEQEAQALLRDVEADLAQEFQQFEKLQVEHRQQVRPKKCTAARGGAEKGWAGMGKRTNAIFTRAYSSGTKRSECNWSATELGGS